MLVSTGTGLGWRRRRRLSQFHQKKPPASGNETSHRRHPPGPRPTEQMPKPPPRRTPRQRGSRPRPNANRIAPDNCLSTIAAYRGSSRRAAVIIGAVVACEKKPVRIGCGQNRVFGCCGFCLRLAITAAAPLRGAAAGVPDCHMARIGIPSARRECVVRSPTPRSANWGRPDPTLLHDLDDATTLNRIGDRYDPFRMPRCDRAGHGISTVGG